MAKCKALMGSTVKGLIKSAYPSIFLSSKSHISCFVVSCETPFRQYLSFAEFPHCPRTLSIGEDHAFGFFLRAMRSLERIVALLPIAMIFVR